MNSFWEDISQLVLYPEAMNFVSLKFWVYFAFAFFFFALLQGIRSNKIYIHTRSVYLFFFSVFLYYFTSGWFVGLLLFSTLLDFFIGKWVYKSKKDLVKKLLIAFSVTVNLGVLCYFKYAYFFVETFNDIVANWHLYNNTEIPERITIINHLAEIGNSISQSLFNENGTFSVDKIILPVGISFYTFQTISYSVDIYRKEITPLKSILDFGFYVTFFPQLVAGPIVRARDFVPQIRKRSTLSKATFGIALFMILKGFIKKKILGDYLAINFIDRVVDNPLAHSGLENLFAMYGYSLQIYADFSGYTDIAIGLALVMGFTLPKNFDSPYKAHSVANFWRRWHLSLSHFLRDYLYIPIGGNKTGSTASYILFSLVVVIFALVSKLYSLIIIYPIVFIVLGIIGRFSPKFKRFITTDINLIITMLLGGLWHGASMNFIIWGGLNGLGLIFYKHWKKISPYEKSKHWATHAWKLFLTFNFITLTRVFFRAQDYERSVGILHQIWNDFQPEIFIHFVTAYWAELLVLVLGLIIHWLHQSIKDKIQNKFVYLHIGFQFVLTILIIISVLQLIDGSKPFVYFQF